MLYERRIGLPRLARACAYGENAALLVVWFVGWLGPGSCDDDIDTPRRQHPVTNSRLKSSVGKTSSCISQGRKFVCVLLVRFVDSFVFPFVVFGS